MYQCHLIGLCLGLTATFTLHADPNYPQWWLDQGVVAAEDFPPPALSDPDYQDWRDANYAPANAGQLKHLAWAAYAAMESAQAGSSGASIASLIGSFSFATEDNYLPINLGQLKAVAQPFFDHLHAMSVAVTLGDGTVITSGSYPWNPATPVAENYYPANLGQLKHVFSFDLSGWPPTGVLDEPAVPSGYDYASVYLIAPTIQHAVVGQNISLEAVALFVGDTVNDVEFFADAGSLGAGDTSSPYQATWMPGSAGTYSLEARATSAGGLTLRSAAIQVAVQADADADGLGDAWETATGITSPIDDADGDGLLASDEYAGGKSPATKDHPVVRLSLFSVSL